jgi:hypothetical protein
MRRHCAGLLAAAFGLALTGPVFTNPAWAFRPFDGTDADVTAWHDIEIELQPAGLLRQGADSTLLAPSEVLNYGFAEGWEVNAQSTGETPLGHRSGSFSLAENGVFLKGVLRPGSLQDATGPSIATEFGLLLPNTAGQTGLGGDAALILSEAGSWGAVHLNLQTQIDDRQHADLFASTILEGPLDWAIRPVGEIFADRNIGGVTTYSLLIGAIWQVEDKLAFDAGLRGAKADGQTISELRLGLTYAFGVDG